MSLLMPQGSIKPGRGPIADSAIVWAGLNLRLRVQAEGYGSSHYPAYALIRRLTALRQ